MTTISNRRWVRPLILIGLVLTLALTACGRLTDAGAGGEGSPPAGGGSSAVPGSPGDPDAPITSEPGDPGSGYHCPDDIPPNPDPDTPVSSCPSDPNPTPEEPQSTPVTPRPGMADVRPVGWERAEVGNDDRTVTLHFWSGVEPCNVLDHIEVDYSSDAVTITLFEGHDPDAQDVACIEIALLKSVTVTLDQPLGGRDLVDGTE
jgi:hypothetical protein